MGTASNDVFNTAQILNYFRSSSQKSCFLFIRRLYTFQRILPTTIHSRLTIQLRSVKSLFFFCRHGFWGLVKESRQHNARTHKAFIAPFICMSFKAVHLVVWDMSTNSFLAASDHFIAHRGIPTQIYSDCEINYVRVA